jgi:hypothetical protein
VVATARQAQAPCFLAAVTADHFQVVAVQVQAVQAVTLKTAVTLLPAQAASACQAA